MKRYFSFYALILSIALLFSCTSTPEPLPGLTGSSVWQVSRDGNTMYLGGSIHILREGDFPLPKEFDIAFFRSDALVLEADTRLMQNPEVAAYLESRMVLPDGQTLQTILDPETFSMLAAVTLEHGFPIEAVANFKPSMVMMILAMIQLYAEGFTQEGIDFYYMRKAENQNVAIYFLESVESQIEMIVSMGEGYENDFVRYSLQDMANTQMSLAEIVSDWRVGKAASTEEALRVMQEEWPVIYHSLITARHDAWMPQIERMLNSGRTYFVIAGLAHMHGPSGLLRLLEDLGYTIEQLR